MVPRGQCFCFVRPAYVEVSSDSLKAALLLRRPEDALKFGGVEEHVTASAMERWSR